MKLKASLFKKDLKDIDKKLQEALDLLNHKNKDDKEVMGEGTVDSVNTSDKAASNVLEWTTPHAMIIRGLQTSQSFSMEETEEELFPGGKGELQRRGGGGGGKGEVEMVHHLFSTKYTLKTRDYTKIKLETTWYQHKRVYLSCNGLDQPAKFSEMVEEYDEYVEKFMKFSIPQLSVLLPPLWRVGLKTGN